MPWFYVRQSKRLNAQNPIVAMSGLLLREGDFTEDSEKGSRGLEQVHTGTSFFRTLRAALNKYQTHKLSQLLKPGLYSSSSSSKFISDIKVHRK